MLFDTHAHMNDPAFDEDREAVILGLKDKGVSHFLNVGCCLESSRDCIAMAEKYPFVYASVGSHPDSADEVNEEVIAQSQILNKKISRNGTAGEIHGEHDEHHDAPPVGQICFGQRIGRKQRY